MKRALIICLALVFTVAANAQKYRSRSHYRQPVVRTNIIVGGTGYYPYASPYRPVPRTIIRTRPTRLEKEVANIKADYKDKIWSAKHDKSIPKSERKREVHDLKVERDKAIRDAEYSYHRR